VDVNTNSDPECSVLLNRTVQDVSAARLQALRRLADFDPVFTSESRLTHRTDQRLPVNDASIIVL
jgi:hypothetical protein